MKIEIPQQPLEEISKKASSKILKNAEHYWRGLSCDTKDIKREDFDVIRKILAKEEYKDKTSSRKVIRVLNAVEKLESKGTGAIVKNLKVLVEAIQNLMKKTKRQWVFSTDDKYESIVAWFVSEVSFVPYDARAQRKSHVKIQLKALERGKYKDISRNIYRDRIVGGVTAAQVLEAAGFMLETPELLKDYDKENETYFKYAQQTGEQFLGSGVAYAATDDEHRWSRGEVKLDHEGSPAKLVMDDMLDQGDASEFSTPEYGDESDEEYGYDDDDNIDEDIDEDDTEEVQKEEQLRVPTHPIVKMFDLRIHEYVTVHINNITPYVYNTELGKKPVLPPEHSELIGALTSSAVHYMEDIVSGKAAGIIVLCSGTPGTGKTLTAEVYAEVVKRPLYIVQCSQLGTDEVALEKNLQDVLNRAQRWQAILLIDESDVYIHERGSNVSQNAIVGVFLRLLEYYKGMLFLTTNRATVVDDAIISRVTAHIRYGIPREEDRKRLWKILAPQFGVNPTDELVDGAVAAFPNISGRSIRQLLKLSAFVAAARQKAVDVETIKHAAKFHDFSEEEKLAGDK